MIKNHILAVNNGNQEDNKIIKLNFLYHDCGQTRMNVYNVSMDIEIIIEDRLIINIIEDHKLVFHTETNYIW